MADNPSGSTEIEDVLYGNSESESEETTTEEVAEVSEEETEETEEEEQSESEGEEGQDEEEELSAIEIDGEEVSLDQILEWKQEAKDGGLRLSDYTKKTMALAEDRKKVTSLNNELENSIAELKAIIDEGDGVDLDELWEDDPSAARKHEKKLENRSKAAKEAKRKLDEVKKVKQAQEAQKLREAKPEWFDKSGQLNDTYKSDTALIQKYSTKLGITPEDNETFTDHRILIALLDAAKFHELQSKAKKVTKVKKKPSTSAAKSKTPSKTRTIEQLFYG